MMLKDSETTRIIATDPNKHIWVSASAGTGKTSLLLKRIIRILLMGESPDKIIAITYTKAAAAEIKERVLSSLQKYAQLKEDLLQKELIALMGADDYSPEYILRARQLYSICQQPDQQFEIQTIHSFCGKLLEMFSQEAGLKVGFAIASKHQQERMLTQAREILLNKSEVQKSLKHLAAFLNISQITELLEEIIGKRGKIISLLFKAGSADNLLAILQDKIGVYHQNKQEIEAEFVAKIDFALLADFFAFVGENGTETEKKRFVNLANKENYKQILKKIFLTDKASLRKKIVSNNIVKNYANYAQIENLAADFEKFWCDLEAFNSYLDSEAIIILALIFINIFDELKQHENLLDFDDVIFSVLKLFLSAEEKEWVFFKLRNKISHILIDEAQDTSPEQWLIVKELIMNLLTPNRDFLKSVFIVGDEKQSIYSFQGANFREYQDHYQSLRSFLQENAQEFLLISLENSYRSQAVILNLVDKIFANYELKSQIISKGEWLNHIPKRAESNIAEAILMPIYQREDRLEEEKASFAFPAEILPVKNKYNDLAEQIALHVKSAMTELKLPADDIMVLVRNRNQLYRALKTAFFQQDIAFGVAETICLNEHVIFMDLLSLAKFYLNPEDDYNLACLLKSPFFSLSEEQLFSLCHARGDKSIYANLVELDNEILAALDALKKIFAQKNFREAYLLLLSEEDIIAKYEGEFGKEEASIIISYFREELFNAKNEEVVGLEAFVHYLEETQKRVDLNTKAKGKISLLTIHASKGLEAKLVIIADVNYNPAPALKDKLLFTQDLLLANVRELKFPFQQDLKQEILARDYGESCRLLYVALTRARDKLHIFASKNDKGFYSYIEQAALDLSYVKLLDDSYQKGQGAAYQLAAEEKTNDNYEVISSCANDAINIRQREETYETMLGSYMHQIWQSLIYQNTAQDFILFKKQIEREIWLTKYDKKEFVSALDRFVKSEFWQNLKENYQFKVEVSLIYEGESLRIDLLAYNQEEVKIIEFKTDKQVENFSSDYITKLALYQHALSSIYVGKKISSYLFFIRHNLALNLADLKK